MYGLDKSTLSVAVKRLVNRGLVAPRKLRDDRGFHGLSLTTDGETVLTAVTAVIADQERRMEAALSSRREKILMTALRRIAGTLT